MFFARRAPMGPRQSEQRVNSQQGRSRSALILVQPPTHSDSLKSSQLAHLLHGKPT